MWVDRYSAVCRECPDLVAIYESPDGRFALLLRQTLVPLPEEFSSLRRATAAPLGRRPRSSERPGSTAASWFCNGSPSARQPLS